MPMKKTMGNTDTTFNLADLSGDLRNNIKVIRMKKNTVACPAAPTYASFIEIICSLAKAIKTGA
jgi:hypothetical protein